MPSWKDEAILLEEPKWRSEAIEIEPEQPLDPAEEEQPSKGYPEGIKKAMGSLVSAFPSPLAPAIGMAVAQTKQSDIVGGFMQAVSNIYEEEKQIDDIINTSEKTGISPAKLTRWQRIVNFFEPDENKEGGTYRISSSDLGVMGPFDVLTSQDPRINEGPGMKIVEDIATGKGLKQIPGALARGTENLIGTAGTLVQQTWETASAGGILANYVFGIKTPGSGYVAEYLVRKYGPKKALELFDKNKEKYAKQGLALADFMDEQANKGWEAPDPKLMEAKWDRAVEYGTAVTVESAPTFAAAIGASYITGNPNVGLAIMGMFEKMNSYRNLRKKDVDIGTADIISSLSGAWEAATEKVPFDFLMKGNGSKIAKAILGGPLEGIQELLAGMGQNFLEYFGYNAKDWQSIPPAAKEGWKHVFDNWLEAVVAGWGLGTGAGIALPSGGSTTQEIEKTANSLNISIEGLTPEEAIDKIGRVVKSRRANEEKVEKAITEAPLINKDVRDAQRELDEARKPIRAITEGMAQKDIESIEAAVEEKTQKIQAATEKLQSALNTEAQQASEALESVVQSMQSVDLAEYTIEENVKIIKLAQEMVKQLQQPIVARQEGQKQADIESVDAQLAEREELIREAEKAIDEAEQKVSEAEAVLKANQQSIEALKPVRDGLGLSRDILRRMINIVRRPEREKELTEAIKPPTVAVEPSKGQGADITPTEGKQPWEMTREEYGQQMRSEGWRPRDIKDTESQARMHKSQVEQALSEGKLVPAEVLAEYKGEKWADEALSPTKGQAGVEGVDIDGVNVKPTVIKKGEIIRDKFVDTIETKDLPPIKEGNIRLYRGQSPIPREGAGRFYTPFLNHAYSYAREQGKDWEIAYIDVPKEIANKYASTKINKEDLGMENVAREYLFPQLATPAKAEGKGEVDLSQTKVVDDKGKPITVYHGTQAKFDKFQTGTPEKGPDSQLGFFFTTDKSHAEVYANWKDKTGEIVEAKLNIKNPYSIDFISYQGKITKGAKGQWNNNAKQWKQELISQGYDGIEIYWQNNPEKMYIAFSEEQISKTTQPPTPAKAEGKGEVEKSVYTSTPKEWNAENDLYDWGQKGLRAKGNRKIGKTKKFTWQSEYETVPVRLTGMKKVLDALKARTDEVFKVHNRSGEDYYLAPPRVIQEVKADLGEEAFKQKPKPERSPKQTINDAINSMKRHEHDDAEIGAFIEGFAKELGLTEADYSANMKKYIEVLNNDPEVDKLRKSFQSGMEEEVPTAEEELGERRAIQEEAELAEEIGDFLDGIVEKETPTDFFGRPILQGGASGKQAEFLNKEDFKTLKERERVNAEQDLEGQQTFPTPKEATVKKEAGFVEVEKVIDAMKTPGRWFLSVFEPAKLTAKAHGKGVVATVIRAFHKPELKVLEFGAEELQDLDLSYNQAEQWLSKYPKEVQEAIMLTRGHGLEGKARALQVKAFASLPQELKDSKVRKALDEIADFNYEYLSSLYAEEVDTLFGKDVKNKPGYVRDYFYGVYKNPKKINNFLSFWKTTDRYTKHKVFPTYADAKAFGLEINDPNPVTNLKAEYKAISYKASMMWLKDELMRLGEGRYIMNRDEAPYTWEHIGGREYADPTFSDVLVEPELAKLINNLISTNKISQFKPLRMLRSVNNFLRTIKFVGSAFHVVQIAKQSVADSGYVGFYKPTATRGFTKGFEKNDPMFQSPEYKWYVENGGGHNYAVESQAKKAFNDTVSKLTESEQYIVKIGSAPLRIPSGFVNWMFDSYIPKVKYAKYLDEVTKQERKLGRPLTAVETQEIIKEGQNFYGMMNERLYGRSGTITGLLRFVFIAPGYAEGNYRTMLKATFQWGQGEEGFSAGRSRVNILNSWIVTGTLATIGTMILTGKPPDKPETIEEIRDLLKIDTGKKDENGNKIMIDLATYDRDYWDVAFNTLRGRPDIAVSNAITRIGGMKAPTAQMGWDLFSMMQGKTLYNWKDDKVYHITDPLLQKVGKLIAYEVKELLPISASVYKTTRERGVDRATAAIETLLGFRPGRTERDKKEFEIVRDIWDMRDKKEKLSYKINSYDDPWGAVEVYNKTLDSIADNKFITDELREKIDSLKIDPEKVITWKRFPAEKLTVEQLNISIREHTYVRDYKDPEGKWHDRDAPHKGWEDRVKTLRDELKQRGSN